jgi:hypothetical protein
MVQIQAVSTKNGPVLGKIDEESVERHLKRLGVDSAGDKRGKVERLIRAIGELKEPNGSKPRLAHCDTCNCDSPPPSMGYDDCPFCGDAEADDEVSSFAAVVPDVTPVPEDEKDPADQSIDNESSDDEDSDEPEIVEDLLANLPAEEETPKQVKTTAQDVRTRKALNGHANGVSVSVSVDRTQDDKKTGMVKVVAHVEPKQTALTATTELDSSVRKILEYKKTIGTNGWLLGKELARIYDGKLWELRCDTKGRGTHSDFNVFLRTECGIDRGLAGHLMDLSTFTEDEVKQFGESKCSVIVRLPPDKREERVARLKTEIREGKAPTYKDLLAEVRREAPPRPSAFTGKATPESRAAGGKAKVATVGDGQPKVTAVLVLGRNRVPLHQGRDKDTRAQKLTDDPRGELLLANGVLASFQVAADASGDLYVSFEVSRDTAPKADKPAKKPVSKGKAAKMAQTQFAKTLAKSNAAIEKAAKKTIAKRTASAKKTAENPRK